jgi:hypothetical protein
MVEDIAAAHGHANGTDGATRNWNPLPETTMKKLMLNVIGVLLIGFLTSAPAAQSAGDAPPGEQGPRKAQDREAKARTTTAQDAPLASPVGAQLKPGADDDPKRKAFDHGVAALKKTYALADGEVLKCFLPPFSDERRAFFRVATNQQPIEGAMHFRWKKDNLEFWACNTRTEGQNLPDLLTNLAEIYPEEIEGDKEILEAPIEADFVLRAGTSVDKIVARLEVTLQKDLKRPVKLAFQEVDRKVFVAHGKYKFTPVPGTPGREVQIYAKELGRQNSGGGSSGDPKMFISWLGRFVGRRIILDKVENAPQRLSWHDNQPTPLFTEAQWHEYHNPDFVLPRITEQTGVSFREEVRRVRILLITQTK